MRKNQIHEFQLGIYPRTIWIAYKCDKDCIDSSFCNRDLTDVDFSQSVGNEYDARVCENVMFRDDGRYGILIIINNKLNTSKIAHESGHVTTEIFTDIGAYLDPNNQEPFMYLWGYIADCIDRVIKNKFDD